MSYQMPNSARSTRAGRFIARVHKEIQKGFVRSGMKQRDLAEKLGIDRSAVNKQLLGQTNLTLRTIADLAWALDHNIRFSLEPNIAPKGRNLVMISDIDNSVEERNLGRPSTQSNLSENTSPISYELEEYV